MFVKTRSPEHVQDLQLVSTASAVGLDSHPIQHCSRKCCDIYIFTKVTELSYKATTMEDMGEMVGPCITWGTSRSENKHDLQWALKCRDLRFSLHYAGWVTSKISLIVLQCVQPVNFASSRLWRFLPAWIKMSKCPHFLWLSSWFKQRLA